MNKSDPLIPAEEAAYICSVCSRRFYVLGDWERDEIDNHMYFYPFNDKDKECCGVEADLK